MPVSVAEAPFSAHDHPFRRRSLGQMMSSSTVLLLFVIGALIIGLAFLILFHNNLNATKGYKLRSLEHARTELIRDQEDLNMLIAKSQSLQALKSDPQVVSMLKVQKIKFIDGEPPVALTGIGE